MSSDKNKDLHTVGYALTQAFLEFTGSLDNGLLDKEQTEDCYYRACRLSILDEWMPEMIDEEFDIVAQGSDKINFEQFLDLVGNIIKKYGIYYDE